MNKHGILSGTKVYLAGNIEYTSDSVNWRVNLTKELKQMGIKALSPLDKNFICDVEDGGETHKKLKKLREDGEFELVHQYMKKIVSRDLRQVDLSDFFIANIELITPTFGTIHELIVANIQRKPLFIRVQKKQCPLWLMGIVKPNYFYDTFDEIVDTIKKINNKQIKLDNDRWRLLIDDLK